MSSFESPNFSDPNSSATGADASFFAMIFPPVSRRRRGCSSARWPIEVVPTIREQSATASATVENSRAFMSILDAFTALFAS